MNKAYPGGRKLLGESMMFNILVRQTRQLLMFINKKRRIKIKDTQSRALDVNLFLLKIYYPRTTSIWISVLIIMIVPVLCYTGSTGDNISKLNILSGACRQDLQLALPFRFYVIFLLIYSFRPKDIGCTKTSKRLCFSSTVLLRVKGQGVFCFINMTVILTAYYVENVCMW